MDVERALIASVIKEQSMELAASREVGSEHFVGKALGSPGEQGHQPAPGEVWDWLVAHRRRYRAVPSRELFEAVWPSFPLIPVGDPMEAVLRQFVRVVKRRSLIEKLRHLSVVADDMELVEEAEIHMHAAARDLAQFLPTSSVVRFSDSLLRRDKWLKLREERDRTGQTPGVSFYFQELDDLTYGLQAGEFAIYEGFLGIGKSTWTVIQAAANYLEKGLTALVMSPDAADAEKLANRWDSYMAGISYKAMKRLQSSDSDLEKWERIGEMAANSRLEKDMLVVDDMYRPTIDRIYTEVEKYQADYSVLDTIDEVRAPSHLKTTYEINGWAARELRSIARHTKRPMIAVAQAGRDAEEAGATIGNIANSIEIPRKADIVFGMHASPAMQKIHKMELRALKLRDDENLAWTGEFFWNPAIPEFRTWRPEDAVPLRP